MLLRKMSKAQRPLKETVAKDCCLACLSYYKTDILKMVFHYPQIIYGAKATGTGKSMFLRTEKYLSEKSILGKDYALAGV